MRFRPYLFVVATVAIISSSPFAATLCKQTFTVLGKTKGDTAWLYIDEYKSGECQGTRLYAFLLMPGRHAQLTGEVGSDPIGSAWGTSLFVGQPQEQPVRLSDSAGIFVIPGTGRFYIPYDPEFELRWQGTDMDLISWERQRSYPSRDYPVFDAVDAKLLFALPALYKNYSVKEALYYPESGYLVILTHQPIEQVGLDTLHGVLIYKIDAKK